MVYSLEKWKRNLNVNYTKAIDFMKNKSLRHDRAIYDVITTFNFRGMTRLIPKRNVLKCQERESDY